jgi:hypothetical protein
VRSPRELLFRGRQELANLVLWARPPHITVPVPTAVTELAAPDQVADRLRGTLFAAEVEHIAGLLLAHKFPILGITISTGPEIAWRRDYLSGKETEPLYFRTVPYLDFNRSGDHKIVWELNRHQHLVLLAQAFLLTGRGIYLDEIWKQLDSWLEQNPYQCGINWASALEVAFRALSWIWVYHLVGARIPRALRPRFLNSLYQHGFHLEYNLSYYFSRNTHLLGEAVALHALGVLFGHDRWKRTGAQVVRAELDFQVLEDGAHFERSSYYHVYALDFFVFHYILAGRPSDYPPVISRMADYLAALLGPAQKLPFLGDDDGGRLFHPYGCHEQYGRASLATCAILLGNRKQPFCEEDIAAQAAWWLGEEAWTYVKKHEPELPGSRIFRPSGVAVMRWGERQIVIDAGPFGFGRGGHSHADSLSILAREGATEILIDAGTFTYVGDPELRNWFRGSAAHNTVRVEGYDQGEPAGPFGWASKPDVQILEWASTGEYDFLDAECRYNRIRHRRRVLFLKPAIVVVMDEIEGEPRSHKCEQIWHFGSDVVALSPVCYSIASRARLTVPAGTSGVLEKGGRNGWRSSALGRKEEAFAFCVSDICEPPARLVAVLDFTTATTAATVELQTAIVWDCGDQTISFDFRSTGIPVWSLLK